MLVEDDNTAAVPKQQPAPSSNDLLETYETGHAERLRPHKKAILVRVRNLKGMQLGDCQAEANIPE